MTLAELKADLADGQWQTAQDIMWKQGHCSETSMREIRRLASNSNGEIISGQRGYKLTAMGTEEEVMHAALWLRAQAFEMNQRATQIREAFGSRK